MSFPASTTSPFSLTKVILKLNMMSRMKSISTKMSLPMEDLRLEVLQSAVILSKGRFVKAADYQHPAGKSYPDVLNAALKGTMRATYKIATKMTTSQTLNTDLICSR